MVREHVVSLVLSTDMKQHFGTIGLFKAKVAGPAAAAVEAGLPAGVLPLEAMQMDNEAQMLTWKVSKQKGRPWMNATLSGGSYLRPSALVHFPVH